MGFSGDFGSGGEDIWWESTFVLRISRFPTFSSDLTRREVVLCMDI